MQIPRLSEERNLPNEIDLLGPTQVTFRAAAGLGRELAQVGEIIDNAKIAQERVETSKFATEASLAIQRVLQDKTVRDPEALVKSYDEVAVALRKSATQGSYRLKLAKQQALESILRSSTDNLLSRRNVLIVDKGRQGVEAVKKNLFQMVELDPSAADTAVGVYDEQLAQGFHTDQEAEKERVDFRKQLVEQTIMRSTDEYWANKGAGKYANFEPAVQRQLDAAANAQEGALRSARERDEKDIKRITFDTVMNYARSGKFDSPQAQTFTLDALAKDRLSRSDYELAKDVATGRIGFGTTKDSLMLIDAETLAYQPTETNALGLANVYKAKRVVTEMISQRRLGQMSGNSYEALQVLARINGQERFLRGEGPRQNQQDYSRSRNRITETYNSQRNVRMGFTLVDDNIVREYNRYMEMFDTAVRNGVSPVVAADNVVEVMQKQIQLAPSITPTEPIERRLDALREKKSGQR